ncbi:MAG: hypothetical protein ACN2B6_12525 [Rickettsiales bacterium]
MKLFNDSKRDQLPSKFWITHNDRKLYLPIPSEDPDDVYSLPDYEMVDGVYHFYQDRVEDYQLNWKNGQGKVIRDGEPEPQDSEYCYYEYRFSIVVKGLESNGFCIINSGEASIEKLSLSK